ncbi:MAG: DUF2520 domain-containing protein [Thermoanaerobaculia bacterium]|nr:DUF2520 domain-containing protein [Thermoanaerobaculia bacterium]
MIGSDPPLTGLRFSLVGPGRVGRSILAWMKASGAELGEIAGRAADPESEGLSRPVMRVESLESRDEDLLVLAVPDPVLPAVARRLSLRPQARVVLHTSGRRGGEILERLRKRGSIPGSFHPLRAFPETLPDLEIAAETFFALDGDPAAVAMGRRLAGAWGADHGIVPAESRSLYHLGATLAAGGVTTVLAAAASVARSRDLPDGVLDGYRTLARGALDFTPARDPVRGITGPVARGEPSYLEQVRDLEESAPELVPLVLTLARATLRLLEGKGGIGEDSRRELARHLDRIGSDR